MLFFWIMVSFLLLVAIGFITYPLRGQILQKNIKTSVALLSMLLIAMSLFTYHHLGNAQGVRNALLFQTFNNMSAQSEKYNEFLLELKAGLQAQLDKHPEDPITWALLAKIYFTLQDYPHARDTFAKAYALLPEDPDLLVDYATAAYLANNGVVDPNLQLLLDKVARLPPSLGTLSLLANVALDQGDATAAIQYWRTMQKQVPQNSELYQELELTIKFAQQS